MKGTEEENNYEPMDLFMKVIEGIIKLMVMEG